MAALPSIETGGVQMLQGVDPGVVRAEGKAFADLARTGANVANRVQEVITNDQVQDTTVATSREMSEWVTENKSKKYFSAAEAKALGVTETTLKDAAGNDREEIPAHEVYPEAISLKMEEMITQQSGEISAPGARNKWTARMEGMRDDMYTKAVIEAEQTRFKHRIDKTNFDIQEALDASDFATAYVLAEDHPIVEEREQLKEQILLKEEESDYYGAIRSQNPTNMEAEASYLRDDDYEGTMNDNQRYSWAKRLDQEARTIRAAQKAGVDRNIMRELAEVELAVEKGIVGQEKIEEMYEKYPEHATADWWKRLTRKSDERAQEMVDDSNGMARVGMAIDGAGYVDVHGDPDDKKYTDMVYDRTVDELMESGHPDAYRMASEKGTQIARTTGYVPAGMQAQFRAAYNMELPADQLAVLAGSFAEVQKSAPGALDFMSDKEKILMQQIVGLNRAGTPTPEAVEKLRTKIDSQPSDVIARRSTEFKAEGKQGGHNEALDKLITNNWDMTGIKKYIPLMGGPQASTQMQLDFENASSHYYQLTGDLDAARESAFGDLSAIYGTSEINGDKELVRDAIETRYPHIPPDLIEEDKTKYLKAAGVPADQAGNIRVQSDANTATALENPTYSLWHINPDDPMDIHMVINEETGAPIRYAPDAHRINTRKLNEELTDAARKRERKRLAKPENREESRALHRKRMELSDAQMKERKEGRRAERAAKRKAKNAGSDAAVEHVRGRQQEAERDVESLQSLGLIQ